MSSISSPADDLALGRRLSAVRTTTGLSQGAFAEALGLSMRAYANYERGEREMPVALFRAMYAVFGIDPIWLLEGPGDMPIRAASRVMDFQLVDAIVHSVDEQLRSARKRIKPELRLRLLKAAYTLSVEKGQVDAPGIAQLLSVAVR